MVHLRHVFVVLRFHWLPLTSHNWLRIIVNRIYNNSCRTWKQVALLSQRDSATCLSVEILQLQNIAIVWHYLRDSTFSRFYTILKCDRHTHRRTDRYTTTACTALSIASHGKNWKMWYLVHSILSGLKHLWVAYLLKVYVNKRLCYRRGTARRACQ